MQGERRKSREERMRKERGRGRAKNKQAQTEREKKRKVAKGNPSMRETNTENARASNIKKKL